MVIYDYIYLWLPLPMVIYCYLWLLMVIYAYPWLLMLTYGYLNLLKKILCRNLLVHRPNTSNCGIVAPRKATLFKMDNIFPAFLFTARGMLSKRSGDRIGMRTVTPDRERDIELAHELMTIGFLFLCSLKILAQGGHQVTSRWKPFSEASAFADPEERLRWSCLPLPILAMTLCPNFRTVSSLAVGQGTFLQSCQWELALVFFSFDVSNFHAY